MCLGIPAQVVAEPRDGLVAAELAGVRREVSVVLLEGDVRPGEWVLVHVGFALSRIDEDEAARTLDLIADALEAEGVA